MGKNVRDKSVAVELDKPRTLRFDLNAFCELEDIYGSHDEAFKALGTGGMKALRAFTWAGLVHEDESLTLKDVGQLLTMDNIAELTNKITEAVEVALPEADETKNEKAQPEGATQT